MSTSTRELPNEGGSQRELPIYNFYDPPLMEQLERAEKHLGAEVPLPSHGPGEGGNEGGGAPAQPAPESPNPNEHTYHG